MMERIESVLIDGYKVRGLGFILMSLVLILFLAGKGHAQLQVVSYYPGQHQTTFNPSDSVSVTFSSPVQQSSLQNGFTVIGSVSGYVPGTFTIEGNRVDFSPRNGFNEGEQVRVILTGSLTTGGQALDQPFQWSFSVIPEFGGADFEPPVVIALPELSEPNAITSADLTGNLQPDLIVVNANNSIVSVVQNRLLTDDDFQISYTYTSGPVADGEGQSLASVNFPTHSSVVTADLNRDGFQDIIVTQTLNNRLLILRNQATGFTEFDAEYIGTGDRPVQVLAEDFTNNGYIDLAVLAAGSDRLYIHPNDGSGNFLSPIILETGLAPLSAATVDLNNSGFVDIVVALSGDETIEWYRNSGSGQFQRELLIDDLPSVPGTVLAANIYTTAINSDRKELVVLSRDSNSMYLYRFDGNGFELVSNISRPTLSRPVFGALGDFGANGAFDLLTSHFGSNSVGLNLTAQPSFPFGQFSVLQNVPGPAGITIADFSVSGSLDFAVVNNTTGEVSIYLNREKRDGCLFADNALFGDVCVDDTRIIDVEIENVCPFSLIVDVRIEGEGFSTTVTDFEIGPTTTTTVPVQFTPTEARSYQGVLIAEYRRPDGEVIETLVVGLLGRGVEGRLDAVPSEIVFPETQAGNTRTRQAELINTGQIPVQLNSITTTTDVFRVSPSDMTLAPGQRGLVNVFFEPSSAGVFTDTLIASGSSDCNLVEARIVLRGEAFDPGPDLVATTLSPQTGQFTEGESYSFTGTFRLDYEDINTPFRVAFLLNGEVVASGTYQNFQRDQTATFTRSVTFPRAGNVTLSFVVDIDNAIEEANKQNNRINNTITVLDPPLPDLVASSLTPAINVAELRETYTFTGTFVLNTVEVTRPFRVVLLRDGTEIASRSYAGFSVGQSDQITAEVEFERPGNYTISLVVDPENQIEESTTENNRLDRQIRVNRGAVVVRPNPFTPNDDGFNDRVGFDLAGLGDISNAIVRIFGFDGRLIREINALEGVSIFWDGLDAANRELRPGVYLYVVENGNDVVARGAVTLAR